MQYAFYRNGQNIQNFNSNSFYVIQSIKLKDSGNYSCIAKVDGIIKRSKMFYIEVNKWITAPHIWTSADEKIVGDHLNIYCKTSSSTWYADQYFAFYKDGENIRNFSRSDQYEVPFSQVEDSGNYSCEVKIPSRNETKRSKEVYVHIQGPMIRGYENSAFNQNITWLVLSGCILLVSLLSFIP
ncbi:Fc receptor-like B [Lithobates pipiens]